MRCVVTLALAILLQTVVGRNHSSNSELARYERSKIIVRDEYICCGYAIREDNTTGEYRLYYDAFNTRYLFF